MEKRIAAFAARRQFGSVLDGVVQKGNAYLVERHGKAVAAVVPLKVYEAWLAEREKFVAVMQRAAQHASMTEEEADAFAIEVVRAVRAEMRAEKETGESSESHVPSPGAAVT